MKLLESVREWLREMPMRTCSKRCSVTPIASSHSPPLRSSQSAPRRVYEREGDVGNVVFPCGYTVAEDRDTIRLYYGAAETSAPG